MPTCEEFFWYGIILIICICVYGMLYSTLYNTHYGMVYESFSKKKNIIGQGAMVNMIDLRRAIPNTIPFRNEIKQWVVKVPLTPFRAPMVKLPPLSHGAILPKFLLYKMEYLTPVRNQGDCGACWAFALCDVLSDRAMIASGGLFTHNISVQQLLSCFARDGCDGGSPEEASFFLSESDLLLSTENKFPYKQTGGGYVNTKCASGGQYNIGVDKSSVASIVEYIDEKEYIQSIVNSNIENMKLELYQGGPFYCAITVYDDLFTYTGTKPYKPDPKASFVGGHAIEIIGYCNAGEDTRKEYKDTAYWICKNSWGKNWPTRTELNGYFTVVMGSNVCGIESRCGFAVPFVYGPPYKGTPKPIQQLRYTSFKEYIV